MHTLIKQNGLPATALCNYQQHQSHKQHHVNDSGPCASSTRTCILLLRMPCLVQTNQTNFRHRHCRLIGHGNSTRSCDASYSTASMMDDLHSFILEQDLYVSPIALVGAGMGAAVALRLAALHPQLVGALIMAAFNPAQPLDAWWPAQAAQFQGEPRLQSHDRWTPCKCHYHLCEAVVTRVTKVLHSWPRRSPVACCDARFDAFMPGKHCSACS